MSGPVGIGFYGKLPSHGDFLRRRVTDAFVGVWDGWLQECIAASRSTLGDRWLDVYLTSPAWRFACAAGACGPAPVVGVMVPSVDRVGRYFPLTIVAQLPLDASAFAATKADGFFERVERLVIDTLGADVVDFDRFDEQLMMLGQDLELLSPPIVQLDGAASEVLDTHHDAWQLPIGSASNLGSTLEQLMTRRLSAIYDPLVLWWTDGSTKVEPSCLITKGLPHPDSFSALLDGSWISGRWQSVAAQISTTLAREELLVEDVTPPRFRSAAATDVGRVREINQDSFIERTEVGIWAVADGLGGHSQGEVASRMVCDALAEVVPDSSFEDAVESARERVCEVNEQLVRAATRSVNAVSSGSTVVALLARGTRCAVLWAGDSRAYRWRGGQLQQLTRDHSLADAEGAVSTAITRAVGGEPTLLLDLYRDRVHAGDRFLLCSDGLTRTVPDAQIRAWMEHEDIRGAVDGLIKATLEAGAPDNVTALIVEAFT
ncbi:MAG TPA: type VI secretion system-associated protein TagF [Vicinamibacterales bacterium]